MAERLGTIFVELDLDYSKFEKGQYRILAAAKGASESVEKNWRTLGVKSDVIFQAMANGAINAYNMIANKAGTSAAEQFRAQSAMVAKINSLNQQMEKNPLYETLGIKSSAAFKAQKDAIISSYETIKKSSQSTSEDIIRAEKAKNHKLKKLNQEMVGHHEMSMAAMMRAVLRFYAAYYVVSQGIRVVAQGVMSGIKAIDDLKISTIAVAAQITTMQEPENVLENYKKAVVYAEQLNKKLMEIDASSFANYQQIQLMNRAMNLQGVLLDTNNAKQIESFTALTNAVAMFTQGQDKEKQASQEIRALFSGQVKAGNMLAMQMDAQIRKQGEYKDGLKGLVAEGNKYGDTLQRMQPYLLGIVAASGDIQQTWEAVSSSAQTAWGIMQRALFKDVYKDLTKAGRDASEWMKNNAESIADSIRAIYDTLAFGIKATATVMVGFAATTIAYLIKAGDASAWFALRWEAMTTRVTLASSKMAIGFGVFTAAVAGWTVGNLLNKFESVRKAGVMMVYGLVTSWDWFVSKIQIAAEYLRRFRAFVEKPLNKNAIIEESNARLEALKKEYEAKQKFNDDYRKEQLIAVTDQAIAEAKAKEKAADVPIVPKGGPTDEEIKEAKRLADMKLKIEQDFQNKYQLAIRDGLFKTLEQLRQGYEAQKAEAEKYGASTVLLGKTYQLERQKAIDEAADAAMKKSIDDARKAGDERIAELRRQQKAEEDLHKEAEKFFKDIEDIGKDTYSSESFGDSMAQGINNAIIAMEKMNKMYEKQKSAVEELAKARKKADAMSTETLQQQMDKTKALADLQKKEAKLSVEFPKEQLSAYRTMFGTIGELFDENSRERKAMHNLEMAFAAAEIAINIQKAITTAVAAIANQGMGDPYTAFGRIAAMTALMAGVLSMAGVGFGGGGGGGARPVALAPSTVLGAEPGTASESISKGWELLKDTYDMEYRELSSLNNSMRELNQNITGLVTNIVRTGGVGGMNISVGTSLGAAESLYNSVIKTVTLGLGDVMNKLTFGLSGWLTDTVGGVIGSIFGGGTTKTLLSGGIELGQTTAGALLGGSGMTAQQYAYIKKKKEGGWFSSDKTSYYYEYAALEESIQNQFTDVFRGISETLVELSKGLGTNINTALRYSFELAHIDLVGKTTDEINTAITDFFSTTADKAVETLFGNLLSGYQQVNEGLYETAIRMITWKEVVLETLNMTNQSYSGSISQVLAFSDAIVNLAGDLETLTDSAATYYDKFFTDEEKRNRLEEQLAAAMMDLNKSLPDTREGYRAIIEALDLTTESGMKAYVQMIQMSNAADEYYSAVEDAVTGTDSLTESLKAMSQTIDEWLAKLRVSDLSPVSSMEAYTSQYSAYKSAASSSEAEQQAITDYLNFASQYLQFMQSYGTTGSYRDIYDSVVADVTQIQSGILSRIPTSGDGSLTNGLTFAGEIGREWVVPTYEPQRSSFLKDVGADPETIGKIIAKAISQSNGGSTGGTIQVSVQIDGREIGRTVAKEMRTNSDLQRSVRSLN